MRILSVLSSVSGDSLDSEPEAYQVSHTAQVPAPDDMVLQGVSAVTINQEPTGYSVITPVSRFTQPLSDTSANSELHIVAHTGTTAHVALPAVLDGWLERDNPREINCWWFMLRVCGTQWCTVFLNTHHFDSRWNKVPPRQISLEALFYIPTCSSYLRTEALEMFENKVLRSVTVWILHFKTKVNWDVWALRAGNHAALISELRSLHKDESWSSNSHKLPKHYVALSFPTLFNLCLEYSLVTSCCEHSSLSGSSLSFDGP